MPKAVSRSYPALVTQIKKTIESARKAIQLTKALTYWKIGEDISKHLLNQNGSVGYGKRLYKNLSSDLKIAENTLQQAVRFHKEFPISHARAKLDWTHYRKLITVDDLLLRNRLLKKAEKDNLSTRQLAREIKRAESSLPRHKKFSKPLTAIKGPLYTYKAKPGESGYILVDVGFSITRQIKIKGEIRKGGIITSQRIEESAKVGRGSRANNQSPRHTTYDIRHAKSTRSDLYTYKAYLDRVIDGDTLKLHIDLGFDTFIRETVRLRGINTPEIKTTDGQKAKRFVTQFVKQADHMIVKTHREDKYGRYVVDVWVSDIYLNQKLLDNNLAILF